MTGKLTPAEHYRRHRLAFTLALELGCTPKEAEEELARRESRARWEQTNARLEAARNAPPAHQPPDWTAPWMMRD